MNTKLEVERELHKKLDAMAGACSERSQAGESHLGCAYCHYLAAFYNDQRVRLNGGKR